jgi:MoaA/NifB/PqqE/SkfB family radical SAM enzyme
VIINKLKGNYIPEFSALLLGRKKPSVVSVNLTDKCNQRCIYCEIGQGLSKNNSETLSKSDMIWIIDQMSLLKITRLSLCGGEPFLFKDIIDVVEYAFKKNIRCNITTNGMVVPKLNEKALDILRQCNSEINISIDSFDESIQKKTRGVETALSNAINTIKILDEKGIPLTVLSAISKYNYHDLYNSLIKGYGFGVRQILYQPIISYSNYPEKTAIEGKGQLNVKPENADELMNELNRIIKFEKTHNISTNVYRILPWIRKYIMGPSGLKSKWFFLDVLNKFYCREIHAVIDINYHGGIQPCGLSNAKVNIKENREKDLLTLWSEATFQLRYDIKSAKYPLACNGCCHKFSRNLMASVIKYPFANRAALGKVLQVIISRALNKTYKHALVK